MRPLTNGMNEFLRCAVHASPDDCCVLFYRSYTYAMCLDAVYELWLTQYATRLNDSGDIDPDADVAGTARRLDVAETIIHPFHLQATSFQVFAVVYGGL